MEGLLWKWTNYWSGWQPRWFILDDGILSYYNSQDEVGKGCKGSIKMAVCDVLVDHTDSYRLELSIASEQHFYLKAANSKERQQWLVALGSCKATLQTLSDPTNYISEKEHKILHSGMKQKKSELRIYCDLLMQQVHAMKEANTAEPPDPQKVAQCSTLLTETCDTFIHTLEDCMKLVDNPTRSRHSSGREVTKPSSPVTPSMKHTFPGPHSPSHESFTHLPILPVSNLPRSILRKTRRSHSQSSGTGTDTDAESPSTHLKAFSNGRVGPKANNAYNHTSSTAPRSSSSEPEDTDNNNHNKEAEFSDALPTLNHKDAVPSSHGDTSNGEPSSRELSKISEHDSSLPRSANFFNTMGSSFINMSGTLDDGVNTKNFTACAAELARIFDKLSATAFSPVKNDLLGNVKKIEMKWKTDPRGLSTLQKLVDYEIRNKQHLDPNSATQALLWLTRGLLFVSNILVELPKQSTLLMAVSIAYDRTLKPFHNFVVKGVVSIGMRALPYKENFIKSFAEDTASDVTEEQFLACALRDTKHYQESVIEVCAPIIEFYRKHNMIVLQDQTDS